MTRPRIAFVTNTLTLGGTEKMLQSCAVALDRERYDVHVVGVQALGPRAQELEAAGLAVTCAESDRARLASLLRGTDLVHVFRHGIAEPLVPAACRDAGVPHLVEENIFGARDTSADEAQFGCHLFMSKFCLLRYRRKGGGADDADFHRRHKVLSAPIEIDALRDLAPSKEDARRLLGLDPTRPVVGRVGRAADLKWRRMVVDMVPHLLELVPETQVLFVGATEAKIARLRRLGVLDRCTLVEPTLDPRRLTAYYAALDVFTHGAEIGESQGLVLGESLAMGVPVVTSSTPWVDNAQVEFVEHGRSGWYAGHARPFAEAVADLLRDPAKREAFGAAGRADVERLLSPGDLRGRLEQLYDALLRTGRPPGPEEWSPGAAESERFAAEYARRSRLEFRPLTARERAEALAMRARERAIQVRSAAEPTLRRMKDDARHRLARS